MSSSTVVLPLERSRYFVDRDGVLSTSKREDEIMQLILDWTDQLGSDTISSVAYVDSGVTTSSKSTTTTKSTCNVTGVGETEITATLASGRSLQRVVRFYDAEGHKQADYTGDI